MAPFKAPNDSKRPLFQELLSRASPLINYVRATISPTRRRTFGEIKCPDQFTYAINRPSASIDPDRDRLTGSDNHLVDAAGSGFVLRNRRRHG